MMGNGLSKLLSQALIEFEVGVREGAVTICRSIRMLEVLPIAGEIASDLGPSRGVLSEQKRFDWIVS